MARNVFQKRKSKNMNKNTLGKYVRECREKAGLSQQAVANKLDLHVTYISKIERGAYVPGLRVLKSLAETLGVSLPQLSSRMMTAKGFDLNPSDFGIKTTEGTITREEMRLIESFRKQPRSVQTFVVGALK